VPLPHSAHPISTNVNSALTNHDATNTAETPVVQPETTNVPPWRANPDAPEQTLVLENQDVRYTFTSHGGGVKFIELKQYPATVECRKQNASTTKQLASLNATAPSPVLA